MTLQEVFKEFAVLSADDKSSLIEMAKKHVAAVARSRVFTLHPGQRVFFMESRTGQRIEGTFSRMKQKYAEVLSDMDRYGNKRAHGNLRWSVPPEMLKVIEEAKQ